MLKQPFVKNHITTEESLSKYIAKLTSDPIKYRCPISLCLMNDPVFMSDGHTVDRSSAISWFKTQRQNYYGDYYDEDIRDEEEYTQEEDPEEPPPYDFTDDEDEEGGGDGGFEARRSSSTVNHIFFPSVRPLTRSSNNNNNNNSSSRTPAVSYNQKEFDNIPLFSPLTGKELESAALVTNHAKKSELEDFKRHRCKQCFEVIDYLLRNMKLRDEVCNGELSIAPKKTVEALLNELFEQVKEIDGSQSSHYHELYIRFRMQLTQEAIDNESMNTFEQLDLQLSVWKAMKSLAEYYQSEKEVELMLSQLESTLDCMMGFDFRKLKKESSKFDGCDDVVGQKRSLKDNLKLSDSERENITLFFTTFSSMLSQVITLYKQEEGEDGLIQIASLDERLSYISSVSSKFDHLRSSGIDLLYSHWCIVKSSKRLLKRLISLIGKHESDNSKKMRLTNDNKNRRVPLYDLYFYLSKSYKIGSAKSTKLVQKAIRLAKSDTSDIAEVSQKLLVMYDRYLFLMRQSNPTREEELDACMNCVQYLMTIYSDPTLAFCERVLDYLSDKYKPTPSIVNNHLISILVKRNKLGHALKLIHDQDNIDSSLTELVNEHVKRVQQRMEELESANKSLRMEAIRLSKGKCTYTWEVSTHMFEHLKNRAGTLVESQPFFVDGREFKIEIGHNEKVEQGCLEYYLHCLDATPLNPCTAQVVLRLLHNGRPGFYAHHYASQQMKFSVEGREGFGTDQFCELHVLNVSNFHHQQQESTVWKFQVEVNVIPNSK